MNAIVQFDAVTSLAEQYGLTAAAFLHTVKSVAMPPNHSDAELVSCLLVAREHALNPLTKEIYFMRDKHGKIQPIVSVDGWIKKFNAHAQFNGMEFRSETDDADVGVTCIIYRKDRDHPTQITEWLSECKQVRKKKDGTLVDGPWDTHPKRMLRHRALCQCVRVAFGFAGIMAPDEFDQWHSIDADHDSPPIALDSKTVSSPRDGGYLVMRNEPRKRPAANAFKQIGGEDKYHALIAAIDACTTIDELHACYDGFARNRTPWFEFPYGWAKLVQDAYSHRLQELAADGDDLLTDQDGFITAIEDAVAAVTTPADLHDVIDCNADLVARCSPDNQQKIQLLYDAAQLKELKGDA